MAVIYGFDHSILFWIQETLRGPALTSVMSSLSVSLSRVSTQT